MQHKTTMTLPEADPESAAHSAKVAEHLRQRMAGGVISFAEYLTEVLYAPGLGYYSAGSAKFGEEGDFITSPEVSPLFGAVLARQVAEVLAAMEDACVLEVGAGSGKLSVDALKALARLQALPSEYLIFEVSADLRARQKARLEKAVPELCERVTWLDAPPTSIHGVVLANEVLDALPFERFSIAGDKVRQVCVTSQADSFVWTSRPAPPWLEEAVQQIEAESGHRFDDGYTSEVSTATMSWVSEFGAALDQGAMFLIDYGVPRREYYAPDRFDGWLRCHFRHHPHNDPLVLPGIQDITSWVDFTAVAEAAQSVGLDILGYNTQSQFLTGGGLDQELATFADLPLVRQMELSGQVKTLTLPGEMGENFKCIALGRGDIPTPSAFRFSDRTQTL